MFTLIFILSICLLADLIKTRDVRSKAIFFFCTLFMCLDLEEDIFEIKCARIEFGLTIV